MGRTISMNDLMRRLNKIDEESGGKNRDGDDEEKDKMDDFDRLKKEIALLLRELREQMKERDEMKEGANRQEAIKLSQSIRRQLGEVKTKANKLSDIYKKFANKKGYIPGKKWDEDLLAKRKEQVDLVKEHVKEVEKLNKRRFQTKTQQESSSRVSGTQSDAPVGGKDFNSLPDNPQDSNLPEIDISGDLAQIKEKDKVIDEGLDEIHGGVKRLRNLATNMNDELKTQETMIDEIDNKMERHQTDIDNLNDKLKKTLDKAGGCERFIFLIVFVAIIIGCLGLVWHVVAGWI